MQNKIAVDVIFVCKFSKFGNLQLESFEPGMFYWTGNQNMFHVKQEQYVANENQTGIDRQIDKRKNENKSILVRQNKDWQNKDRLKNCIFSTSMITHAIQNFVI